MNALASPHVADQHAQIRRLYLSLLQDQNRFDEFKQLLALYPAGATDEEETAEAEEVRFKLNMRINEWLSGEFDGLTAAHLRLWRSIVVEERINVVLSPWRESNAY